MDPHRYQAPQFGQARREPGNKWSFWYFSPAPLPRHLALDDLSVHHLVEAEAALGRLNGLAHAISDPELLIAAYRAREAVYSSRIEGTQASLSDVFKAQASSQPAADNDEDVAEVQRYIRATQHGFSSLTTLPLTARLIKEMHKILLTGGRGQEKLPGQFRSTPVWIGSATDTIDTALFVPPLPTEVGECFADWEKFVNDSGQLEGGITVRLPTLVRCALMHYQFETIHPFLDGNGRLGRLLISLLLNVEGRLDKPLLYLSGYLESHRSTYYDYLQEVREKGKIQEWIQFFCQAVCDQALDAVQRSQLLVALREDYRRQAMGSRSGLSSLVDVLFLNPYVTVSRVEEAMSMTNSGARRLLREAQQRGWITQLPAVGRGGKMYWVAERILHVLESPVVPPPPGPFG